MKFGVRARGVIVPVGFPLQENNAEILVQTVCRESERFENLKDLERKKEKKKNERSENLQIPTASFSEQKIFLVQDTILGTTPLNLCPKKGRRGPRKEEIRSF